MSQPNPAKPFVSAHDPVIATLVMDLFNDYSVDHLRFAIDELRKLVGPLTKEDTRSDQQRARYRILRFLDLYLSRAHKWAESEADLMATLARGLFELRVWARFVSESEANASQFIKESDIDQKELYDRLVKLIPPDEHPIPPEVTGKRLAVRPEDGLEELMWKMASKLIHPSSWSINNFDDTMNSADNTKMFAVQTVRYGWEIVNMFHNIEWLEPELPKT